MLHLKLDAKSERKCYSLAFLWSKSVNPKLWILEFTIHTTCCKTFVTGHLNIGALFVSELIWN